MKHLSKEQLKKEISLLERKRKNLLEEKQIQEYNVKDAKKVKNLKIFAGISKLLAPFCISSSIVLLTGFSNNIGFPFIRDKEEKSKCYILEVDEEGISASENYEEDSYDSDYPTSDITLFSPWVYDNGYYERTVTSYEIKELDDVNVYYSILDNNFDYIYENFEFVTQEKEIKNISDSNNINVKASIYIRDENDKIYVIETLKRNLIVTILEMLFICISSCMVVIGTKDKIIFEIRRKKSDYNNELNNMELINKKLKSLDCELKQYKDKAKRYEK